MCKLDDGKFSDKDLYQHLWEGRNIELSHFWQRSIFLTGIFVVLLSSYGKVVFAMYFPESGGINSLPIQHLIAWGLSFLCLVFSILWIMMSKGSKYYYERYEESLNALFEKSSLLNNTTENMPRHGALDHPSDERYSDSLFSTNAGGYSVSKVNITIGIIGVFVFLLLNALHFAEMLKIRFENEIESFQCAMFSIAEILVVFVLLFFFLKILCKSGEAK